MEVNHFMYLSSINAGDKRPLWSVLIPTYNCAAFLVHTLESVLQQDPGPEKMEIIVIDDHSTYDDPEEVVRKVGKGRVQFFRQPKNVGKVRNYETGLVKAKGVLIHQLHGDDKVRPGFYAAMEKVFNDFPDVSAAFCRSLYINESGVWKQMTGIERSESGILEDAFERLFITQIIQTPSMVIKRSVYETVGTFDRRFNCLEDWEMWLRIAYKYQIAFINSVLAEYRIHESNATSVTLLSGELLQTHQLLDHILKQTYSDRITQSLLRRRNSEQAGFLIQSIKNVQLSNKMRSKYVRYILRLTRNPKLIYSLFS